MLKQTIVWTTLPHGSEGPRAPGTKLHLSVFVSPRLWTDDPTVTSLKLSDFPDFLDWPATVAGATFQVNFQGGPSVPATVVTTKPLRSDLWKALFKNDTPVIPFKFENMTGVEVMSFPAAEIHDTIKGIYQRAATDPTYGAGADLPPRGVLGADPDLAGIAVEVERQPPYQPVPVDDAPVFVGTRGPEPTGGGGEKDGGDNTGCLSGCAGCLALPVALLRRLFKALGLIATLPVAMLMGGGLPLTAGAGGPRPRSTVVLAPDGPAGAPASAPAIAKKAAFDQLHAFVQPTSVVSEPMPSEPELADTFDFHQMISTLGDYPNLLRYLGLVIDLEVTVPAALPAVTGTVTVMPALPLALVTTSYTPHTHYELGDGRFGARPRPGGELNDGLLRLNDTARFRVLQLEVAGSGTKVQTAATEIVNQERNNDWPGNAPEEQGLPNLRTAGLSVVRPETAAQLKEIFTRSYALNKALAVVDGSPVTPATGSEPSPSDEVWAEDLVRGYRVDVFDDKSAAWHSLCRRVGTYTFAEAEGGPVTLSDEEDESFVQAGATEQVKRQAIRTLRVHESLFTWSGWSLAAPRVGKTILPDHTTSEPPNEPVTRFKMQAAFLAKPKSLPRLRFGYSYRLRARAVDLAGDSVFAPDDPAFAATQAEVTPEIMFRRFEPVSPPMVLPKAKPIEGESLERLVVRSAFDDPAVLVEAQATERHLVPPKTSQVMAELHRRFDGTPNMQGALAGYRLAGREAGSLTHRVDPVTGDPEPIPGAIEVTEGDHTFWLQMNETFDLPYLPDPYARGVLLLGLSGMAAADQIVEPDGAIVNKIPFQGTWPDLKPLRLRLTGISAGVAPAQPHWNGTDRVLTVQIPQGETQQVRICSYFRPEDLENMAVWDWIEETAAASLADLRAQAAAGRNWLHLPYRTLTLVHAVQQPLAIPTVNTLASNKKLGDTLVSLAGQLQVDAKSTSRVDLRAAWRDPFDDPSQPTYDELAGFVSQEMHVGEVTVSDAANDAVDFPALQHAIGDTKYHRITYTPIATTRYREYFPGAVTANPANLIRPTAAEAGTPAAEAARKAIDILNSARPDAARPLYVLPTFAWDRGSSGSHFETVRHAGGLRVYLARPWFSSGAGELLGIVLRPPGAAIGSDQAELLKKYTSEWGMDPLWPAASTDPMAIANLLTPAAPPQRVLLAEIDAEVDVVGYRPHYDVDRNLWYCDIPLDPGDAYFPMVRLALVRFQPNSVAGAHISTVTLADFIQIAPPRTVAYDATQVDVDGSIRVEVAGPTYFFRQMERRGVSQMILRLEQRSDVAGGDELGWEPIATRLMRPVQLGPEQAVWSDIIAAPLPRPVPLRLVLLEIELHPADGRADQDILNLVKGLDLPGLGGVEANITATQSMGYRVTFADAIELP